MSTRRWLALDIGGANIKAAHSWGAARAVPFELWKHPQALAPQLREVAASLPAFDRVAFTTTAELCDCFATKREGIGTILDAVHDAFPDVWQGVWCVDGRFHSPWDVRGAPGMVAAANWLAIATLGARLVPDGGGMVIDVGSTTTDLIPTHHGQPAPRGRTDTDRLRSGELVYAGAHRTPICGLATEIHWRGGPIGLAAELFATMGDVCLILGLIPEDSADRSTADGRPATREWARDRLARIVGGDRESITTEGATELAQAIHDLWIARMVAVARRVGPAPEGVMIAGSGEFLARRVAEQVVRPGGRIVSGSEIWGTTASVAGCAFALLQLVREQEG